jgi:hypothetical protein
MKVYLKIKIKSLALEAETIRREEKKYKTHYEYLKSLDGLPNRDQDILDKNKSQSLTTRIALHEHRVNQVRKEARAALLAYGFLNGRAYTEIEGYTRTGFSWKRVEELVKKYGEGDQRTLLQQFAEWRDNAQDHIDLMILAESAPEVQDDLKVD